MTTEEIHDECCAAICYPDARKWILLEDHQEGMKREESEELVKALNLMCKAKAQLEYVENDSWKVVVDETDDSDDLFWNGGVKIWE